MARCIAPVLVPRHSGLGAPLLGAALPAPPACGSGPAVLVGQLAAPAVVPARLRQQPAPHPHAGCALPCSTRANVEMLESLDGMVGAYGVADEVATAIQGKKQELQVGAQKNA